VNTLSLHDALPILYRKYNFLFPPRGNVSNKCKVMRPKVFTVVTVVTTFQGVTACSMVGDY
jgi:hypothetical protein